MTKKTKWIIAGSTLGVVAITTAIVLPIVLINNSSVKRNEDSLFLNTNLVVEEEVNGTYGDNELIAMGSIFNEEIDGEQVIVPSEDIDTKDLADMIMNSNNLDSFSFESVYINVMVLETVKIVNSTYVPISYSYGLTDAHLSRDYYTLHLDYFDSTYSELILTSDSDNGSDFILGNSFLKFEDNMGGFEMEPIGKDQKFDNVESMFFLSNTLQVNELANVNDSSFKISNYYTMNIYSEAHMMNGEWETIDNTGNSAEDGFLKGTSVQYELKTPSGTTNIEVGKNKFYVW